MSHGVAVIGLGIMGHRMMAAMAAHERFSLRAGWDPSPEARALAVETHPGLRLADGPEDAIGEAGVKLVYVACPPRHHREHALATLAAGKALFLEKPLGIDVAECRDLVARIEAAEVPVAVNFSFASSATCADMKDSIDGGDLGSVRGVDIRVHFARWPRDWQAAAQWVGGRDQGGFTREYLSHPLYLTHRLLGPGQPVRAAVRFPEDEAETETQVLALLDFGGVPVTVHGSRGGRGPDCIDYAVWGDRASLMLRDGYHLSRSDGGPWTPLPATIADPRTDAGVRQLDNLAAMLDGRPHTMPSAADGLAVQELVEGILAA